MRAVTAACVASVVAAAFWRVSTTRATAGFRTASVLAAIGLPLAIGGWYLAGPGRPGWAARAGTPASLLPHTSTVAAAAPAAVPATAFTSSFSGRIRQSAQDASGHVLVSISGRTSGSTPGVLWIRLQGQPIEDGGVSMTASGASYGPPGNPDAYVGKIVGLEGSRILLSLDGSSSTLSLLVDLQLDAATGRATGTVHGEPTGVQ
jgi:hypothetical protein